MGQIESLSDQESSKIESLKESVTLKVKIRWTKFHQVAQALALVLMPEVFYIPIACECKKFKQILLHKEGLECPHHLMISPPLNLHS